MVAGAGRRSRHSQVLGPQSGSMTCLGQCFSSGKKSGCQHIVPRRQWLVRAIDPECGELRQRRGREVEIGSAGIGGAVGELDHSRKSEGAEPTLLAHPCRVERRRM